MKTEIITELAANLKLAFGNALDEIIDKVGAMLEANIVGNANDENQNSSTQMTISPKILIQYAMPEKFVIEVQIPTNLPARGGKGKMKFKTRENWWDKNSYISDNGKFLLHVDADDAEYTCMPRNFITGSGKGKSKVRAMKACALRCEQAGEYYAQRAAEMRAAIEEEEADAESVRKGRQS